MKRKIELSVCVLVVAALTVYYLLHAGYLAIPSEDFLGNFLPFVNAVLSGHFEDIDNKLLPVYPLLLAAASHLFSGRDAVLTASLVINFLLIVPYFFAAYIVFSRFMSKRMTVAALFFLAVNSYTLYTAINPELEIFLATMTLSAFALMAKGYRGDTAFAVIVAATKWDSVFIVPAVAWRRFSPGKYLKKAFITCVIASSLFALWVAGMFLMHIGDKAENIYVGEIAQRGPNIYRFLADAFLVPSGFIQWAGLDLYYSWPSAVSVLSALAAVVFGVLFLAAIIFGVRHFAKTDNLLKTPIAIYAAGFFLVHMVYQNTKDKYVLPIIWFVVLVAFIGFERQLLPLLRERIRSRGAKLSAVIVSLCMAGAATAVAVRTMDPAVILSTAAVSAVWILWLYHLSGMKQWALLCVCALSVFFVGMNFSYGKTIFDHYSLRRVEFRYAGEWFRENVNSNKRVLVSEETVFCYFSGIPKRKVIITKDMHANDLESFDREIRRRHIGHLYIDDFYIKRLITHDKNAIDRKAELMKNFRDRIGTMKGYTLLKTISTDAGNNGYIYRVDPLRGRLPSPTTPDWKYELGL